MQKKFYTLTDEAIAIIEEHPQRSRGEWISWLIVESQKPQPTLADLLDRLNEIKSLLQKEKEAL